MTNVARITKFTSAFLFAIAFVLMLQAFTANAYATSANRQMTSNEVLEVDTVEEQRNIKLEKGKTYLFSYPVEGEGWQLSKVRYCIPKNIWRIFDKDVEDQYISVEACEENEPGKVQIMLKCKSTKIIGLDIILENEITGEKKSYAFPLSVTLPQEEEEHEYILWQPDNGDGDNNNDDENNNDDVEEKEPIIIDTTGWTFDAITVVYDGTEHIVEVMGLPDYVTPVYTDNTRTNAGTNKAHVSFLVPEGYATPADMETTLTIEKAPIYVITGQNLVEIGDGKLQFSIPKDALPNGIDYTYTVNDVVADSDYAIANTGMYIVTADFEMTGEVPEEIQQNYSMDSSSAIYNVIEHEDVVPSEYGLNFRLSLEQEESQNPSEVKVTVKIKFDSVYGRNSVLTYVPVYDSSVLTYQGSELPEHMGGGKINSAGVVAAYKTEGGLLEDGILTTFIFTVNEGADTSNLPFTITEVLGAWIGPDPSVVDKSKAYSTAIVLNPDVDANQYTVMLPYPEGRQTIALAQENEEVSLEVVGLTNAIDAISDGTKESLNGVDFVSTEAEKASKEVRDVSTGTEEISKEMENVSTETEESSKEVENVSTKMEETPKEVENSSNKTDEVSEEAEAISNEVENSFNEAENSYVEVVDATGEPIESREG